MARPARVDVVDGWYHVTSRGIERRRIYVEERDYAHFQELLEKTVEQFRIRLHAFVQMPNHYHLIVQTPEANLSRAIQWLNVREAFGREGRPLHASARVGGQAAAAVGCATLCRHDVTGGWRGRWGDGLHGCGHGGQEARAAGSPCPGFTADDAADRGPVCNVKT